MGMCINRRVAAVVLGACVASASWAQSFPSKPLKIIVPFGAGGVADLTARTVAQKLSQNLGQPVVIENKPGAGGVGASDTVAKSTPDGHTLLLMSNASAVSATLFKSLPYDTVKDFTPVSTLGFFDIGVVTAADSRFKTLGELLAYAKANPGKLNVGSINIGSTQNLAAELFKATAGIDVQIVPFNGTPAVVNALRGGQIDAGLDILSPLLAQIRGRVLQPLAVTGDKRSRVLPEVPTAQESGIAGFVAASWNGLAVPAGTPREVVARLNREVVAALNDPVVKKKLEDLNLDPHPGTPEQAAAMLNNDIKRWREVIARARIERQ